MITNVSDALRVVRESREVVVRVLAGDRTIVAL